MNEETTPEFQQITPEHLAAEMTGGPVPPPLPPDTVSTASDAPETWPKQGADGQWRDKDGRIYDPEAHRMGLDGVPEVTPGGYFSRRSAENPASDFRDAETPPPASGGQSGAENLHFPGLSGDGDPQQQAQLLVVVEEMAAVGVFGMEWTLLPEEKARLVAAWVETFKVTGVVTLPWWAVLVMAHWSIVGPRLGQPETKSKLAQMQARCGAWLARLRGGQPPEDQ